MSSSAAWGSSIIARRIVGRAAALLLVRASPWVTSSLFAQASATDSAAVRTPVACTGQRVDSIAIYTSPPTDTLLQGGNNEAVRAASRFVRGVSRAVHVTTYPSVIRRIMLLQRGDQCTEVRRTETERLLRTEPFIAQARVLAFADDSGGVDLDVRTIDEASLVVGGSFQAAPPPVQSVELGNSNFNGSGMFVAGSYQAGDGYRDGFGGRIFDQDLFGHPWLLGLQGDRRPLGEAVDIDASHPFVTDLQRIAWVVRTGSSIDYITYPTDSSIDRALRLDRRYSDIGGIVRVGRPGRLSLFGASISSDDEEPSQEPVLITPTGLVPDANPTLYSRFQPHKMARVNFLWGVRDIHYVPVRGLDALEATQDLPVGFAWGTQFGRSLEALGSTDNDIFTASDVYVGMGDDHAAFRLQGEAEGRHDNDSNTWDGILSSGRAAEFIHLMPRQTLVSSVEWSGGLHERIPFNLTLSDPLGGVRGYWRSQTPGAERLVGRLESRWDVMRVRQYGELGFAAFTDAGRLWAGDVPFGVTTPLRRSVGFSLLGAFPAQSARLWRVDVAFAQNPELGGDHVEVRLIGSDVTRFFFEEPSDVERARERTVPSSIFRWP